MISKLKYEFSRNMVHNYTLYSYYNSIGYFDKATYISITFCELSAGKLVTKGTYAKMDEVKWLDSWQKTALKIPKK